VNQSIFEGSLVEVMPKAKKFLLLHERRESWRVSRIITERAFCHTCDAATDWLSTEQITYLAYSRELEEPLHSRNTKDGKVLICRNSLEKFVNSKRKGESR